MNIRIAKNRIVAAIIFISAFLSQVSLAGQPPITLPPGTYNFGPVGINDKVKSVAATIDRSLWTNPAVRLSVTVTINTDPGWACSYGSRGGPGGLTFFYCPVPPGTKRQVSAEVVVTGGTFTANIDPSFSTRE